MNSVQILQHYMPLQIYADGFRGNIQMQQSRRVKLADNFGHLAHSFQNPGNGVFLHPDISQVCPEGNQILPLGCPDQKAAALCKEDLRM